MLASANLDDYNIPLFLRFVKGFCKKNCEQIVNIYDFFPESAKTPGKKRESAETFGKIYLTFVLFLFII